MDKCFVNLYFGPLLFLFIHLLTKLCFHQILFPRTILEYVGILIAAIEMRNRNQSKEAPKNNRTTKYLPKFVDNSEINEVGQQIDLLYKSSVVIIDAVLLYQDKIYNEILYKVTNCKVINSNIQ